MSFAKEVNTTNYGITHLGALKKLIDGGFIYSEYTGENKGLTKEQLREKFPSGYTYLDWIVSQVNYLDKYGSGSDPDSATYRIPHIRSMEVYFEYLNRLNFIEFVDLQVEGYLGQNVGWGQIKFNLEDETGSTFYIGDKLYSDVDLPMKINAIDFQGELITELEIVNYSTNGKLNLSINELIPINPTLGLVDDNYRTYSFFDFLVIREEHERDNDIIITNYPTDMLSDCDFSSGISYDEYCELQDNYNSLPDNVLLKYAIGNLLLFAIDDINQWKQGYKLVKYLQKHLDVLKNDYIEWQKYINEKSGGKGSSKTPNDLLLMVSTTDKVVYQTEVLYCDPNFDENQEPQFELKTIALLSRLFVISQDRDITRRKNFNPTLMVEVVRDEDGKESFKEINPLGILAVSSEDWVVDVVRREASMQVKGVNPEELINQYALERYNSIVNFLHKLPQQA